MAEAKQKAVFIDRDGTLVEEVDFLSRLEDLRVFPFSLEAVSLLKEAGYLVVVVTNQSGIGRKLFDEAAMHAIHNKIQQELNLTAFYFCPHLPGDGCACRKPNTGMIEAAVRDFNIDLSASWMIGDKTIDIETGSNAGTKKALVLTGYGQGDREKLVNDPEVIAEDLLSVVKRILER